MIFEIDLFEVKKTRYFERRMTRQREGRRDAEISNSLHVSVYLLLKCVATLEDFTSIDKKYKKKTKQH